MAKVKKTHTLDEVDAQTAESFIYGMHETYAIIEDVVVKLKGSIEDVQGIYYTGDVVGKRSQQLAELQVACDTLTQLHDMMAAAYAKALESNTDALHVELHRASLMSLKEEWPL
jgi:hypothetical protein